MSYRLSARSIAQFMALALALSGAPLGAADALLLNSGPQTAAVRADLIKNAQSEVIISSYMIHNDRAGLTTMAYLREALRKKPPVKVTLLVDDLNFKIPDSVVDHLVAEGAEIYRYHPFSFDAGFDLANMLNRSHDKLLIVDGQHIVVGDRNIGNEYYGLSKTPAVSRDAYTNDPDAIAKSIDYVKRTIAQGMLNGEIKRANLLGIDRQADGGYILDQQVRDTVERYLRPFANWRDDLIPVDDVLFAHTGLNDLEKMNDIENELLHALHFANEKIIIENPYILLTQEFRDAIQAARHRGVKIYVYTNSRASSDNPLVAAAWEESRDFLNSLRAEILEHPGAATRRGPPAKAKGIRARVDRANARIQGANERLKQRIRKLVRGGREKFFESRNFLHSKAIVIDDVVTYIMSYNLDERSQRLNREVLLRFRGAAFAKTTTTAIQRDAGDLKYVLVAKGGKLTGLALPCPWYYRWVAKIPLLRRQL